MPGRTRNSSRGPSARRRRPRPSPTAPSTDFRQGKETIMSLRENAKPLRSILFCPGDNEEALHRCYAAGPDAMMIDLEEPRTPFTEPQREAARANVARFLESRPASGGPQIFARVQPPDTGQTMKDLRAVLPSRKITAILQPKIYSPLDVGGLDAILNCAEVESGIEMGSTAIYPILE